MKRLLILGAGGHAKVLAETALAIGAFSNISFLDDKYNLLNPCPSILGSQVIGPLSLALDPDIRSSYDAAAVAIGHSPIRLLWIERLLSVGYSLPPLIHPMAWVSPSALLGHASVVFANSAIQSDVSIGTGSIINTGSSVDHDCIISDGVHICPGARVAGHVSVGPRSWIGIGASVIQQVAIGSDVTVGAGSVVIRDLPNDVTAVGVPAAILL